MGLEEKGGINLDINPYLKETWGRSKGSRIQD